MSEAYEFDALTGEYLGPAARVVDPRASKRLGVVTYAGLAPNQTAIQPPESVSGMARVWTGAEWSHVADNRGQTWWDENGNKVEIEKLGDPASIGLSSVAPPPPPPSANHVREESSRRMQAMFGARDAAHLEIIIANSTREAVRLLRKGDENWTPDEAARATQLEQADMMVEAIRAASNAMESNPPDDYTDDKYWP